MGHREDRLVTPGPEKSEARPLQCQCVIEKERRRQTRPAGRKAKHIGQVGRRAHHCHRHSGTERERRMRTAYPTNPTTNDTGQPAGAGSDYALPATARDPTDFAGSRVLLIVNRPDISGRLDCRQCITGDTLTIWLMCRFGSYATTAVRLLIAWLVVNA